MRENIKNRKWRRRAEFFSSLLLTFAIFLVLLSQRTYAQLSNDDCKTCHGKKDFHKMLPDGTIRSLYIDFNLFSKSAHKSERCIYCHIDVKEFPCKTPLQQVDCQRCHYKGNLAGAPSSERYRQYQESIHGMARMAGNTKAPICQDCHGSHYIFHKDNPLSKTNQENIPRNCGRCHVDIYSVYQSSIHGLAVEKEKKYEAATCTDCHTEHTIRRHTDLSSSVYVSQVSATCARCHANMDLLRKFGIPIEAVETYKESFHGVASKFGAKTAANCPSCHGYHDILPAKDPRSSINPSHLPKTCGKCHPGASKNFAKGKVHINPSKKEAGIIYYVAQFFKYLTLSVMIALVLHIILDLRKRYKIKKTVGKE